MPGAFSGDEQNKIYCSLALIATFISSGFSFTMILLIRRMNRWTGFTYLIYGVAYMQLIYDVTFFNSLISVTSDAVSVAANSLQIYSEIAVTLITNVIGGITLYVVIWKKSFDLLYYVPHIFLAIGLWSITYSILYYVAIFATESSLTLRDIMFIYLITRAASLAINVIFAITIFIWLIRLGSFQSETVESKALRSFGWRLFLYPTVQVLSRVSRMVYDIVYGYNAAPEYGFNYNPNNTTKRQFDLQCLIALTMPIASIGYLCIFLVMQPRAYPVLREMLFGRISPNCEVDETDLPKGTTHVGRNTVNSAGRSTVQGTSMVGANSAGRFSSILMIGGRFGQNKSCGDFLSFLEEDLQLSDVVAGSIGMTSFSSRTPHGRDGLDVDVETNNSSNSYIITDNVIHSMSSTRSETVRSISSQWSRSSAPRNTSARSDGAVNAFASIS